MRHFLTTALISLSLSLSLLLAGQVRADDPLAKLEAAAQQDDQLQPGLESYQAVVETAKIREMIEKMTASMPSNLPRPAAPTVHKYWLRGAPRSLILAEGEQSNPYVAQMVERFSSSLAVELDALLLPADKIAERRELAGQATIKSTELVLDSNLMQRIDILFASPTDLNQAFYHTGLRLPQKQITSLTFDIDGKSGTITELTVVTADNLKLTAEIRYRQLASGNLPERLRVTSPDGQIDDLFDVHFAETAGYLLPTRMVRTIRRPDLQEDLDVSFKNYRVNQPLPEQVRTQLSVGP